MNLQRFPQQGCLQARPKQTILGHEELFGPTELGRLGGHERNPKHCSSLEYGPDCLPHKLNSAALCLLLLPGRRRHQVQNQPPHVGHCCSSSVPFSTTPSPLQSGQVFMCAPLGDATTPPRFIFAEALLIRQSQMRSGKSSPDEFVTFWKNVAVSSPHVLGLFKVVIS